MLLISRAEGVIAAAAVAMAMLSAAATSPAESAVAVSGAGAWSRVLGAPREHDILLDAGADAGGRIRVLVERRSADAGAGNVRLHLWTVDAASGQMLEDVALPADPAATVATVRRTAAFGGGGMLLQKMGRRYLLSSGEGAPRVAIGPQLEALLAWGMVGSEHVLVSGVARGEPVTALLDMRGGSSRTVVIPAPSPLITDVVEAADGSAWLVGTRLPQAAAGAAGEQAEAATAHANAMTAQGWIARVDAGGAVLADATLDGRDVALTARNGGGAIVVMNTSADSAAQALAAVTLDVNLRETSRQDIAVLAQAGPIAKPQACALGDGRILVASAEQGRPWTARLEGDGKITVVAAAGADDTAPFTLACTGDAGFVLSLGVARISQHGRWLNFQKVQMRRFAASGGRP